MIRPTILKLTTNSTTQYVNKSYHRMYFKDHDASTIVLARYDLPMKTIMQLMIISAFTKLKIG